MWIDQWFSEQLQLLLADNHKLAPSADRGYVWVHWQCTVRFCAKSKCSMQTDRSNKLWFIYLFMLYSLRWSKLYNLCALSVDSDTTACANLFCSEHAIKWDSRLAFGRTIYVLVSFQILFYLDAQIWQKHELKHGASGRRGRRQVVHFQSALLMSLCETNTRQKHMCNSLFDSITLFWFHIVPDCCERKWLNEFSRACCVFLICIWQLEWTQRHLKCLYAFHLCSLKESKACYK